MRRPRSRALMRRFPCGVPTQCPSNQRSAAHTLGISRKGGKRNAISWPLERNRDGPAAGGILATAKPLDVAPDMQGGVWREKAHAKGPVAARPVKAVGQKINFARPLIRIENQIAVVKCLVGAIGHVDDG